jgi:hypothetical protein
MREEGESCGVSANKYSCTYYTGALINFGVINNVNRAAVLLNSSAKLIFRVMKPEGTSQSL